MTEQNKTTANHTMPPKFDKTAPLAGLAGLFGNMHALITMMPGGAIDANQPLSSDEEIEAMFDNMPV